MSGYGLHEPFRLIEESQTTPCVREYIAQMFVDFHINKVIMLSWSIPDTRVTKQIRGPQTPLQRNEVK